MARYEVPLLLAFAETRWLAEDVVCGSMRAFEVPATHA